METNTTTDFKGALTDKGITLQMEMNKLTHVLGEPVQLIEVAIDRYVMSYLERMTDGYGFDGPFGNYSVRYYDDLNCYLSIMAIEKDQADNPLYQYENRECRYQILMSQGLIGRKFIRMKLALAKRIIEDVTEWSKEVKLTFDEALNNLMCHMIILDNRLFDR